MALFYQQEPRDSTSQRFVSFRKTDQLLCLVPQSGIEPASPVYKTGPHPLKASGAYGAGCRIRTCEGLLRLLTRQVPSATWLTQHLVLFNYLYTIHQRCPNDNGIFIGGRCRIRTDCPPVMSRTLIPLKLTALFGARNGSRTRMPLRAARFKHAA